MWLYALFLGILISYFSFTFPDAVQATATAIGLLAIIIAYMQFKEGVERDRILSVIDQLRFFREKVLGIEKQMFSEKNAPNIPMVGTLEDFSYEWAYSRHKDIVLKQEKFISEHNLEQSLTEMFNALEEFSWNVYLHKTHEHQVLSVVRDSFIQLTESFAAHILIKRLNMPNQYAGIEDLYRKWEPTFIRETKEQKLERVNKRVSELLSNQ